MTEKKRKNFLELEVIWKDDVMFEMLVTAASNHFEGVTEVYESSGYLQELAQKLNRFPEKGKEFFYEAGNKETFSYFSMKLSYLDILGLVKLETDLVKNSSLEYGQDGKNNMRMEILVELSAIDNFQNELLRMAGKREGKAILKGRYN